MFHCGYQTGEEFSDTRRNWTDDGPRPLKWSAWYPSSDIEDCEKAVGFFDLKDARLSAPIAEGKFPLVVMSHGTGGSAEGMSWLGTALAKKGFIVLGANHHGNTSAEDYLAEGFVCWWERVEDLSELLNHHLSVGPFAKAIDNNRITGVGFSVGGYTVMSMAGAITRLENYFNWRDDTGLPMSGPTEFPDVEDHIPELKARSSVFKASWDTHTRNLFDPRIKSLVLLAPAPPVRSFDGASVEQISIPTMIVSASGDKDASKQDGGDFLEALNPAFAHHDLGEHVRHYTFISLPTRKELIERVQIFHDHPSVDRKQVHQEIIDLILPALA